MTGSGQPASTVFLVDDDGLIRHSISNLLRSLELRVETFDSSAAFLTHKRPNGPSCLVLDIRMPGGSGLDLQQKLREDGDEIPIVFLTGYADVRMSVQALKAGATDFLTKPFREQDLIDAVLTAIERDRRRLAALDTSVGMNTRFERLSEREKQVMALVTSGLMNKQVAGRLGISEITVKVHRANVMDKMQARSFAELVRMADALKLGDRYASEQSGISAWAEVYPNMAALARH